MSNLGSAGRGLVLSFLAAAVAALNCNSSDDGATQVPSIDGSSNEDATTAQDATVDAMDAAEPDASPGVDALPPLDASPDADSGGISDGGASDADASDGDGRASCALAGATYDAGAGLALNEFPLPNALSQPVHITAGPDGNMWFAEFGGRIGRITADDCLAEFPTPTPPAILPAAGVPVQGPSGITLGPDGNLWFGDGNGHVDHVTPAGDVTEFPSPFLADAGYAPDAAFTIHNLVPADINPAAATTGPDGNLWFTAACCSVFRVTPAGTMTQVLEFPARDGGNDELHAIVSGPDGNLWFSHTGAGSIVRLTTAGAYTEFAVPGSVAGGLTGPIGVAVGPDGNLWFTDHDTNRVGRMTTAGVFTLFDVPTPSSGPWGITAGPDGDLWFAEADGNAIARVTTSGQFTEFPLPNADSRPHYIVAGPRSTVWFTEFDGNRVGRFTLP